jgi:hypothetical protein
VRCASAVLEQVRGFSLDGFAQGALSDCTITLHAGMGVGQLSVLYVGGDQPRNEPAAEDAAQPSILQGPHAALRRDGVAVMGAPITQLQKAEAKAGPGECVMSPELWALVAGQGVEAELDPEGFALLSTVRSPQTDALERPPTRRERALRAPELRLPGALRQLAAFNPEPVQHRLRVAGRNWLADFRVASVLFMRT